MQFSLQMKLLDNFYGVKTEGIWADDGAKYFSEIDIDLSEIFPVVAAPHNVDNIKSVAEVAGTIVHEGLIGTCTNGRIEDMRIAAAILKGKTIKDSFQLNIIPASRKIFLQAIEEGMISLLLKQAQMYLLLPVARVLVQDRVYLLTDILLSQQQTVIFPAGWEIKRLRSILHHQQQLRTHL